MRILCRHEAQHVVIKLEAESLKGKLRNIGGRGEMAASVASLYSKKSRLSPVFHCRRGHYRPTGVTHLLDRMRKNSGSSKRDGHRL